jgi:hypothetical protein
VWRGSILRDGGSSTQEVVAASDAVDASAGGALSDMGSCHQAVRVAKLG